MSQINKKISIILGTRPEIIKMSPIIKECQKRGIDFFVLHTGQHYNKELSEDIFFELDLPRPEYNLGIGNEPYRKQVGMMTNSIRQILHNENPDVILVQGDTISVLAGALAAQKLGIRIAHHESGLRSHDTSMLEEVNRVVVDSISDFLFAPTPDALKNLYQEGRDPSSIFFSGNTIVDVINGNLEKASNKSNILSSLGLIKNGYCLITCHRAENVDKKERLEALFSGLERIAREFNETLIFPIHPRTQNRINEFKINIPKQIVFIKPIGFFDFLQLQSNAKIIFTDSGGVQEEAFILGIPCVTLRENTERPETIEAGRNILTGIQPESIVDGFRKMVNLEKMKNNLICPFGDGRAAQRIIDVLEKI